ncbi:MAG: hypothetical protein R3E68_21505 [Burkholderiaceae bacterium]
MTLITSRRHTMLGLLVAAATLLGSPLQAAPAVSALAKPSPQQILFVGNSYFYYNDSLHNHVRRLTDAAGAVKMDDQKFRSVTISGGSLAHHPIAHYMTPGAIGYKKPFDLVILQGNSGAALSDKGIKAFAEAARQAGAAIKPTGAQVALYMTHAYAKGHKKYDAANAEKIEKLYVDVGNEIGVGAAGRSRVRRTRCASAPTPVPAQRAGRQPSQPRRHLPGRLRRDGRHLSGVAGRQPVRLLRQAHKDTAASPRKRSPTRPCGDSMALDPHQHGPAADGGWRRPATRCAHKSRPGRALIRPPSRCSTMWPSARCRWASRWR